MGSCVSFSKCKKGKDADAGVPQTEVIPFSWETRKTNLNMDDFVLKDKENETIWKLPGSVNGQQFVIRNCTHCLVYLLDHVNSVTFDDCKECKLATGPIVGSISVRDCVDCTLVVAASQFRMRDCTSMDVLLYCPTQPCIESSSQIGFGCYQLFYDSIEDHFNKCQFDIWNNSWYNIYDFTPSKQSSEPNWCYLPYNFNLDLCFNIKCLPEQLTRHKLSFDPGLSQIPKTSGFSHYNTDTCFTDCKAICTGQLELSAKQSEYFCDGVKKATEGPVIGMLLAGRMIRKHVEKAAIDIFLSEDQYMVLPRESGQVFFSILSTS
ncbi:hypothetical protein M8J76_015979 [Diaphorina citri]|nr:hypothetical protein M8J75_009376 [Diaphorina citri]KAI5745977.1 hypothetical protein M8J76_015979 [Diaphorina citri]